MKKITLIAVVLLGFVWQGWGQEKEGKKSSSSTTINQLKKEIVDLKTALVENRTIDELQKEKKKLEDLIDFKKDTFFSNERILKLDFKDKKIIGLDKFEDIKIGELYQIQVESINMNLYKVVLNKKDTIITSKVEFPSFDLIKLGDISEILSKIDITSLSQQTKNQIDKIFYKSNQVDFDSLSRPEINIENIKQRIQGEIYLLLLKEGNILENKDMIDSISLSIQKKIYSYYVLDKSNHHYHLLSRDVLLEDIILDIENIRKKIVIFKKELLRQREKYLGYIMDDKIKKVMTNELKEEDKTLQTAFAKAISNVEALYENINSEKVASWIKELIYKENNSVSSYTTLSQQFNGDKAKLNIQIIPLNEESKLPSYQTEIQFPQKRKFYIGGGMSFYHAWLKNEVYSVKSIKIDEDNIDYAIIDEKNKKGELGMTALIHFGWRPFYDKGKDWFALNFVTGPALSLTHIVKPRVAIGGGVAFGTKNMFTINGLYIVGYVDKKSEVFNTDDTYNSLPENVTVSKLGGGFAVSVGYIYKF